MNNTDLENTCCAPSSTPASDKRKASKNMQAFGDKAAETLAVLVYKIQDSGRGEDDALYQFARKAKESLEQLSESLRSGGFGGMGKKIAFISNAGQALQKVLEGMNEDDEHMMRDVHEFSNKAREAIDKLIASFGEALESGCQDSQAQCERTESPRIGDQQDEDKRGAIHGNAEVSKEEASQQKTS